MVEVIDEVPVEQATTILEDSASTVVDTSVPIAEIPAPKRRRRKTAKPIVPEAPKEEKHCPACLNGESIDEGEGTHLLLTVEHPYDPPEIFKDAESSVVAPAPKPVKVHARPMAKELRLASSFAEKNLPKKIAEKAKLLGELARCEAEIQEYVRVIQALKGQTPVGLPNAAPQQSFVAYAPTAPQLPPLYPEYAQPAPVLPTVAPVKPMAAGGAGVAAGMLEVPSHWYDGN